MSRTRLKRRWSKCSYCHEPIYLPIKYYNKKRYCSRDCSNKDHSELSRERANSNKNPWKIRCWNKGLRYDSLKTRGPNNWNWKGGKFRWNYRIRRCSLYCDWIKAVFKRDNWTCQKCGKHGGRLSPHHKISLLKIINKYNFETWEDVKRCKILWDINNGITLCHDCHKLTDSYGKNGISKTKYDATGEDN